MNISNLFLEVKARSLVFAIISFFLCLNPCVCLYTAKNYLIQRLGLCSPTLITWSLVKHFLLKYYIYFTESITHLKQNAACECEVLYLVMRKLFVQAAKLNG